MGRRPRIFALLGGEFPVGYAGERYGIFLGQGRDRPYVWDGSGSPLAKASRRASQADSNAALWATPYGGHALVARLQKTPDLGAPDHAPST
jgi:hypothetical protein